MRIPLLKLLRREKRPARFTKLLETAEEIAKINPGGLRDLVRAILRPYQADHLLAVAEEVSRVRSSVQPVAIFGEVVGSRAWDDRGRRAHKWPNEHFKIHLARDIVLPGPWHHQKYVCALAKIGNGKIDPERTCPDYEASPWRENFNHKVALWLPWGIGFVQGGNHSIAAGILAGEGVVTPTDVYDMSYLFSEIISDGLTYREINTGKEIGPVVDQRAAALFEIGRIMHRTGFPAFRDSVEAATENPTQ